MALDSENVTTVTFDSYGTLVDVDAVEAALAPHVEDPAAVSRLWRQRSLEYAFVSNAVDAYEPFYDVLRRSLSYALAANGVDLGREERESVLETYHELDAFDDVADGMARLREAGYDLYVLSNGDPEMLSSMVEHAGIEEYVTDTVSADEVETFKPETEPYRHAAARTGTPIDELLHVAAGWWDVLGATHAGMQTAWVNRAGDPWETVGGDPDLEVDSIHEVADALDA